MGDMLIFQLLEKTSITPRDSGKVTGPNIEPHTHTTKIAQSPNQTTGRVLNNALNHGNAEEPDSVKEVDGAQDMMDVKELHSQIIEKDECITQLLSHQSLCNQLKEKRLFLTLI